MFDFIAASTMGLESVVCRELKRLGIEARNSDFETGRTLFQGELSDLVKANIRLRCAGKIFVKLAEFEIEDDFDVIFDAAREIEWERWAPRDAAFLVEGRSIQSKITSVPALQRTVKKAIVDRLTRVWGLNRLPETGSTFNVEIILRKNRGTIVANSSGRGLHRRGYRLMNVAAPLRETLASALVQLSVWKPGRPFIDPFCASGTIPIEAAMIGRNIAPGLTRDFSAQAWPIIPSRLWEEAREEAREEILPHLETPIIGSDIDAEALKFARRHAELAGVAQDVKFIQRDFRDLSDDREYGCVVCNPPYGDRLGDAKSLRSLYEAMPAVLSKLPTWSHFILTALPDFEKTIGQEATRRRKLFNSRIECSYYQFLGPAPPKSPQQSSVKSEESQDRPDAASLHEVEVKENALKPVFPGLDAYADRQAIEFGRCLANCARRLRRFPSRGISCYRVYDRDLPEVPFAIDVFDGKWLHIAEYERPDGRGVGQHRLWVDKMTAKAAEVLQIPLENVFLKRRARQRGESQYEKLDESGRVIRVKEGGLVFLCNMTDYLDVGLFLDHRLTREMARREAKDKRFLNLFCYSGSFTCYAADGGASSSVSVDLSPRCLEWCEANLEENRLDDPEKHRMIKSDVLRFLRAIPPASGRNCDVVKLIEETAAELGDPKRRAHYGRKSISNVRTPKGRVETRGVLPERPFGIDRSDFELCVCDPPTFSNSKSTDSDWDVQRRHVELLRILSTRMTRGGVVYFSTNFRKFKFDEANLVDLYDLREISARTIPEDFRNKRIHRCWRMIAK